MSNVPYNKTASSSDFLVKRNFKDLHKNQKIYSTFHKIIYKEIYEKFYLLFMLKR